MQAASDDSSDEDEDSANKKLAKEAKTMFKVYANSDKKSGHSVLAKEELKRLFHDLGFQTKAHTLKQKHTEMSGMDSSMAVTSCTPALSNLCNLQEVPAHRLEKPNSSTGGKTMPSCSTRSFNHATIVMKTSMMCCSRRAVMASKTM